MRGCELFVMWRNGRRIFFKCRFCNEDWGSSRRCSPLRLLLKRGKSLSQNYIVLSEKNLIGIQERDTWSSCFSRNERKSPLKLRKRNQVCSSSGVKFWSFRKFAENRKKFSEGKKNCDSTKNFDLICVWKKAFEKF